MKTEQTPIVHVLDDDASVRAALEDLLASSGLNAQTYASVQEFLTAPRPDAPGCLVLDVRMPGQSGMEFQRQMGALGIHLPVIFITGHGDIAMGVAAMKQGAIEFLTKPFRDQELLDAVWHGIELDRARRAEAAALDALRARWDALNVGEKSVARLVVQGLLNKQIAAELSVSEITIKVRRSHVMRKMQAKSLADLVRMLEKLPSLGMS